MECQGYTSLGQGKLPTSSRAHEVGIGDTILFDLPVRNVAKAVVSPEWVMTEARLKSLLEAD
jgi:hypothetical protein